MNARREPLRNAVKIDQSERGKPKSKTEEQMDAIERKLDALLKLGGGRNTKTKGWGHE
jgi:hypothetical protein